MTCIVVTRNPENGDVLAIEDDRGKAAHWHNKEAALAAAREHRLVKAWGGYVIDLDEMRITEVYVV